MTDFSDERGDEELQALLRQSVPTPTARFEADLRRQLFPQRRASSRRTGLVGLTAATGGLALVLVVAGLVGGGPLASNGGDGARATPGCETVYVTEVRPAGEVVQKEDGTVSVETTKRPVPRAIERCR